jgi:hypothetical protein
MIDFSNNFVDRTLPTISISEIIGLLQEPFDQRGVAQKTYEKHFNNPDSQYYQKTVEEICEMWSAKGAESCRYGSLLDDYIGINLTQGSDELELWKLDNNYDWDERLLAHCNSFDDFYSVLSASGDMEFVDREKSLYYRCGDYYVKGRFDALFYNKKTNKYIIIDWKSSGSIDKIPGQYTKKLFGPAMKFPALNYYTYTMQLHFYKKALIAQYLPEGTTEDDIIVMIVNLPDHIIESTGKRFETHTEAFKYDSVFMDQLFNFGIRKKQLLSKKQ